VRVTPAPNDNGKTVPRILLVDDDVVFGQIMLGFAKEQNLALTYCRSTEQVSRLTQFNFQLAVIDYDLGAITGIQLSHFLERFLYSIPVILVSQYREINRSPLPPCIREFIHKSAGPSEILEAALRTLRYEYSK